MSSKDQLYKDQLYKWLATGGIPAHGGSGAWSLPRGKRPGAWRKESGPLRLCGAGTLHLCRRDDLVHWISAELYEAEVRGTVETGHDKIGCLEARLTRRVTTWNERTARLFATDCAERALQREREAGREPAPASWEAVAVARRYANGTATDAELSAAAAEAARAAAAAEAAELAWQSGRLWMYLNGQERRDS